MTQREQFEAWAKAQGINTERDGFGGYESHWTDGALAGWQAAQAQAIDATLDATLKDRDDYHQFADDLAAQIAAITGVDIGEHSSANNPWQEAMLAADDFIAEQLRTLLKPKAQATWGSETLPHPSPVVAEPVGKFLLYEGYYEHMADCYAGDDAVFLYTAPPDHTALLKQALDALDGLVINNESMSGGDISMVIAKAIAAIESIRKAIK